MKTVILILALIYPGLFALGQDTGKNKTQDKTQDLPEEKKADRDGFKLVPDERYQSPEFFEEFIRKFNNDSALTEQFPGSDRYYAKRPVFAPYDGFFAEPDSSVKFYLIIKDPLRNTVRK